jgi:hypothetical protein
MRQNRWVILGYGAAVLVFFVVAAYVVLFATGYKFDWTTKTLKKTGFLLVETYPKGANLKVAGRKTGTTPVTVKRLLPGDYLVEIERESYRPWKATLGVTSGLVTEKRNTLLTLKNLSSEVVLDKTVGGFALAPNRSRVAVVTNGEVSLLNVQDKTTSTILAPTLILQQVKGLDGRDMASGKIISLAFGPDNRTLILDIQGKRNLYHLMLNADTGTMSLLARGILTRIFWVNSTDLIFLQNSKLYFARTDGAPKAIADKIIDCSVVDGTIYAIDQDQFGKHFLLKVEKDGATKTEAENLPVAKSYELAKMDGSWMLITSSGGPESIWISTRAEGKLVWDKLASNVTSRVLWDNDYLVYQTGSDLMVVKTKQEVGEPQAVARGSGWDFAHFSFDTLLYIDNGKLRSIDITGRNKYELFPLSSSSRVDVLSSQMSQLIYIGTDKKLYTAKLREETAGLLNLDKLNPVG